MGKPNFKLKIELLNRGITQAKLAHSIGRSPAHVCRIIRGLARPRARDRKRIAAFLGIFEGELFHVHHRRKDRVSRLAPPTRVAYKGYSSAKGKNRQETGQAGN